MSFSEICAQYKTIRFHSKRYVWSVPNTKKMVLFKKILLQIMNGLHTATIKNQSELETVLPLNLWALAMIKNQSEQDALLPLNKIPPFS